MYLTPYTSLTWAYQLHYYLCFRTHRRKEVFFSDEILVGLQHQLSEISTIHDYHLLDYQIYNNHARVLFSLQPSQRIAKVIQTLKSNSARELATIFATPVPLWARGYFARSTGHVRTSVVSQYLLSQSEHHGYANRVLPPVFEYKAAEVRLLKAAHASFDLNHHLVFSTKNRKGVFTSTTGASLTDYWLEVATKRDFAIDQISIVPDHVHMIVRIVPKVSIEEVALCLLNNGQHYIGKYHPNLLIANGIDQLWNASAYAGTCGEYTTALIMKWLQSNE